MSGIFNTKDGVFGNYSIGETSESMSPEEAEAASKAAADAAKEVIAMMGFLGKAIGPTVMNMIKNAGSNIIPVIKKLPIPDKYKNKILSAADYEAKKARVNKAARRSIRNTGSNSSKNYNSESSNNYAIAAIGAASIIAIGLIATRKGKR